jgi:uncharacterized membrane protein
MSKDLILKIILIVSVVGVLFSGYLSYSEVFKQTCLLGGCSNVGGIPTCVYGFVMYTIIFILSLIGLKSKK